MHVQCTYRISLSCTLFITADFRNWKPSLTMDSMVEIPEIQAAMKAKHVSGSKYMYV